jgi:hypothetical protein
MTEKKSNITAAEATSRAGKSRAKNLSPERRREIAQMGGMAKGKVGLPRATHGGTLKLGDKEIECGVLPDKTRVISCASIRTTLGISRPASKDRKRAKDADLPSFLLPKNLSPYFEEVLQEGSFLIQYVNKFGVKTEGVKAEFLPKICEVYLKARRGADLSEAQKPIALTCEIILSSLAKVGIIALVDESSGYQEERAKGDLQILLEKYISEELRKWTKKFPNEFFKQIYRLHGWEYPNVDKATMKKKNHPRYVGNIINKHIYDKLPPGIRQELERKNPANEYGMRSHKHHQFLTEDVGDDNLQKQITQVVTLMRVSDNLEDFKRLAEKV